MKVDSNISAPTKFVQVGNERYAYRRLGNGSGLPLLFLQHFTGTLDNWDPAVTQPCLVMNVVLDSMIPVRNSYFLAEHLPKAMLLTYPDAGHGSLFQFHESFVKQASLFLDSEVF